MKKDYVLFGLLAAAVIWAGVVTFQKSQVVKEKEIQYVELTTAKDSLQIQKDSTLNDLKVAEEKIDNLLTVNYQASQEMNRLKKQIRNLLYKGSVTVKELKKAKGLIEELNAKIIELVKENGELKSQNSQLQSDKNQLTIEKNQLSKVLDSTREEKKKSDDLVNLGSTLTVSNVTASGINRKGKTTSVAEKVTAVRLTFTVNENRISPSGNKTVHLVLHNPLGVTIGNHGVVSTEDGEIVCTGETVIDYSTGLTKNVSFDVPLEKLTVDGPYHLVLYENGMKISQKTLALKKKRILGFF